MQEIIDKVIKRFNPEVWLHKEAYISVEVPTKGGLLLLSLFALSSDHKDRARGFTYFFHGVVTNFPG